MNTLRKKVGKQTRNGLNCYKVKNEEWIGKECQQKRSDIREGNTYRAIT